MILDQLIKKMAFVKVRDRLLEGEEDLTLEKALLLASRIEDVALDSSVTEAVAGSLRDTMSGGRNKEGRNKEGRQQQHGAEPEVTGPEVTGG